MKRLTLRSFAKLNLYLKVLRKRPDGYHDLKTLFERIDLSDRITLRLNKSGKIRITCNHPQVPCGRKNLVYKVAEKLQKQFGISWGVDIHIQKQIPVAAGLAGGSSNAATTLIGLNKLWKLFLGKKELLQIGRQIGSDVPFFLINATWALGLGRGDVLKEKKIPVKLWHILVVPKRKMYTKEVYQRLNLKLTKTSDNVNILLRSLKKYNINRAKELFCNDLETSIIRISPSLLKVKKRLESMVGRGVSFSGSGPSVFGVVNSPREAHKAKKILSRLYGQVFVVRTF